MPFRVSEEKIVYSDEPIDGGEYTRELDRAYSKYAKLYDWSVKVFPFWKTWIKKVLPYIEGERVLECSFGTGYLLMQYADQFETQGIDYNKEMIELASENLRMKGKCAKLHWANVEALPFEENQFDTVINTMAFSGYPDGRKAMAEFYRVLVPGGTLLLIDFNYPTNRNYVGYWLAKLMESAGDTLKDISGILGDFPFEVSEEEIGGFGSVHFYRARKRE